MVMLTITTLLTSLLRTLQSNYIKQGVMLYFEYPIFYVGFSFINKTNEKAIAIITFECGSNQFYRI